LMAQMESRSDADLGTLVVEQTSQALAADPNAVKAVRSTAGWAMYFSRASLPYDRGAVDRRHLPARFWHHMGVYAFRREKLAASVALGPSPLERVERLEQLRALEAGWRIWLEPAAAAFGRGIDTPEDLEAARALIASR